MGSGYSARCGPLPQILTHSSCPAHAAANAESGARAGSPTRSGEEVKGESNTQISHFAASSRLISRKTYAAMKSHDEQPPDMLPAQMASFEREIQLLLEQQCLAKARQVADRYVAKSFRASSTIDIATTAWFRSRCLSAQTSLEEGNLGRANDELDELLEHEQSLKSALLCRLLLYSAESNARLNIRPVALRRLSQLKSHSATIQSRPLLQLRELRCWCLLGEVDDVLDAAQHIQQRLAGDDYHLALLCSEIARAFENANKLQVADDYWAKAMLYCSGPTADTIRATVNMHHGRRAHLQGRLQEGRLRGGGAIAPNPPQNCLTQNHVPI